MTWWHPGTTWPEHCPIVTFHSRIATLPWPLFGILSPISTSDERKLGQDGACSISIGKKSYRLQTDPPKPLFWPKQQVSKSHLNWGVTFVSETASKCVRVTQDERVLGQGGACSISIGKKSYQLHSGIKQKISRSHLDWGENYFCQKHPVDCSRKQNKMARDEGWTTFIYWC